MKMALMTPNIQPRPRCWCRKADSVTATAAEVIRASTPVA